MVISSCGANWNCMSSPTNSWSNPSNLRIKASVSTDLMETSTSLTVSWIFWANQYFELQVMDRYYTFFYFCFGFCYLESSCWFCWKLSFVTWVLRFSVFFCWVHLFFFSSYIGQFLVYLCIWFRICLLLAQQHTWKGNLCLVELLVFECGISCY